MCDNNCNDHKIYFDKTEKNKKEYVYETCCWDLKNQLSLKSFLEKTIYDFQYAGKIIKKDDENDKEDKKKIGYKISINDKFKNKKQLLYLITIDFGDYEKIIKGGKVKGKLENRSYTAGTEHNWTMSGTPSSTNYIYSQLFRMCLKKGIPIKFYAFETPLYEVSYKCSNGKEKHIKISPYEEMEKELNAHLKQCLGKNLIGEGKLEQLFKS